MRPRQGAGRRHAGAIAAAAACSALALCLAANARYGASGQQAFAAEPQRDAEELPTSPYGWDSDSSMEFDPHPSQAARVQHHLYDCRFPQAWNMAKCDGNVTVAVIDSGFYLEHPDLADNLLPGYDATTGKPLATSLADGTGHGTAVAGVISAVAENGEGCDGASFNAKVLPIRVKDDEGVIRWWYVRDALRFVLLHADEIQVVNMSVEFATEYPAAEQLLEELHGNGVVCVAAAGNWHSGEDGESIGASRWPASYDNVISVAALDLQGKAAWDSLQNAGVDICAPGEEILTTANPLAEGADGQLYGVARGTSYSAALVTAAAALVVAQNPGISPGDVEARLFGTAVDLGAPRRDDAYGHGMLDAAAAVGWVEPQALAVPASLGVGAMTVFLPFGDAPAAPVEADPNLLRAFGSGSGSAGPDFLGITNTNFDFPVEDWEGAGQLVDYPVSPDMLAGLAIWATSVNESPNPYYVNLLYRVLMDAGLQGPSAQWLANASPASSGGGRQAA